MSAPENPPCPECPARQVMPRIVDPLNKLTENLMTALMEERAAAAGLARLVQLLADQLDSANGGGALVSTRQARQLAIDCQRSAAERLADVGTTMVIVGTKVRAG